MFSCVTRTYFIDPDKDQKSVYTVLLHVRKACLDALRPGVAASSIYRAATRVIQNERPDLSSKFTKNCGFAVGFVLCVDYIII